MHVLCLQVCMYSGFHGACVPVSGIKMLFQSAFMCPSFRSAVISEMNKCMDTVPRAPLYYFCFIVLHKQFDSLIPFQFSLVLLI